MPSSSSHLFAFVIFIVVSAVSCYYLPGVAPVDYAEGEKLNVKANKLTSVKTQLPYDFYDALPFCSPKDVRDEKQNLGEVLKGDRLANSLYNVEFLTDEKCKVLGVGESIRPWHKKENPPTNCTHVYTPEELDKFADKIKKEYRVHWDLDDMPIAMRAIDTTTSETKYIIGFHLGKMLDKDVYLNNHVKFTIKYINGSLPGDYRVVGFEVDVYSIDYYAGVDEAALDEVELANCHYDKTKELKISDVGEKGKRVAWTYSVTWKLDTVSWFERWDRYFDEVDAQIHWFSIVNSLLIVLFLTGMVAMIMIRTLHADFRKYSSKEVESEAEETGWKLLHADVFRPPQHRMLLSSFIGFGAQVFAMTIITLVFSLLGFLSPANRGSLLSGMLVLFVLMGIVAGYNATRMYKMFKGPKWVAETLLTALLIPGVIFCIFMFVDFFIMGAKSSRAVPFKTFAALISLWFCVSVPLVFLGSYIAFKKPAIQNPGSERNTIPRFVPPQVWYMHPVVNVLMGGVLPFGAVFIELFFILGSVWEQRMYYIFSFLFIVFFILIITCAEITTVMCYFQLCSEDYHWWWRAFMTSGSSALYMFLYSVFYFVTKLDISSFVSVLLYFGYMTIFTVFFFLLTGFIGFYACFMFVRKIYSSVPLD